MSNILFHIVFRDQMGLRIKLLRLLNFKTVAIIKNGPASIFGGAVLFIVSD